MRKGVKNVKKPDYNWSYEGSLIFYGFFENYPTKISWVILEGRNSCSHFYGVVL